MTLGLGHVRRLRENDKWSGSHAMPKSKEHGFRLPHFGVGRLAKWRKRDASFPFSYSGRNAGVDLVGFYEEMCVASRLKANRRACFPDKLSMSAFYDGKDAYVQESV